jgi:anti-sigma B factor antagonist
MPHPEGLTGWQEKKEGILFLKKPIALATFALRHCVNSTENAVQHSENHNFMKYRIDKQELYSVLTLEEENLNSTHAPGLKSDLIFLNQEGVRNLILDLSQVKFVDSSGLSAILTGHRLWKDTGSFILAGKMQPMVLKLIEISRLETILTMIPTVDEAIDYVKMEELERELQGEEE